MKFTTSFLSRIQSFAHLRENTSARMLVHPMREWVTCLLVAICISVMLFAFAALDFYTQYTDLDVPEVSETNVPQYRGGDAQSIIKYYEGKSSEFNDLREDHVVVPPTFSEDTASTTVPARVAETPRSQ